MATIKNFTTLEQSKKLAEILPLKSADMYYISGDENDICFGRGVYEEIADWICDGIPKPADIPCWSFAALFGVLPDGTNVIKDKSDTENEKYMCTVGIKDDITSTFSDNPVDACVAMVIKLYELKML